MTGKARLLLRWTDFHAAKKSDLSIILIKFYNMKLNHTIYI